MTIQAAVVRDSGGPFLVEQVQLERPTGDEILVDIVATGICHTDLLIRDQLYPTPLPIVLGHEGAGIVREVGPEVQDIRVGDHVVLTFAACETCPTCRIGLRSYCWNHMPANFSGGRFDGSQWSRPSPLFKAQGQVTERLRGAFFQQSSLATQAIATERNAVVVDPSLPLEILAPLGCGFQTGAGAVFNSLPARRNEPIAVTGAGAVGMAAIMAAAIVGCAPIIAIDTNRSRLALARTLGATHTIDPNEEPIVEAVKKIDKNGVSVSIETTGVPAVLRAAVDILRVHGVCGLIAGSPPGTEVRLEMVHLLFGRSLKGILQGDSVPKVFIPELIEHYVAGRFPIDRLEQRFTLAQVNEAAAAMESGAVIKPVIVMAARR